MRIRGGKKTSPVIPPPLPKEFGLWSKGKWDSPKNFKEGSDVISFI